MILKRRIIMNKKYFFSAIIMFLAFGLVSQSVTSGSFGGTYVPSSGFISIFGDHSFDFADCGMFPGLIVTEREGNRGYVNFTDGATWTNAADDAHVDGYVRTFSSDSFVFPIGNDGKLRLLGISGSENAAASYLFEDPAIVTGVLTISNLDLDAISTREYWRLTGSNETIVTMTWDQLSNIEDLVNGDINKLTIIGWANGEWNIIPSQINNFALATNSGNVFDEDITTSFLIGSLSSVDPINPDDYEIITLGSLSTPRSSFVEDGGISVFPNPARIGTPTYVSYDLKGNKGKIEIYDGFNRLVYSEVLTQSKGNLLIPNLNLLDDRYIITMIEEDGSKKSKYLIMIK